MKTTYMEIVNGNYIGSVENPVDLNEILKKADKEEINSIIKYEIIPMLEEYWFDDLDRVENWKNKLLGE